MDGVCAAASIVAVLDITAKVTTLCGKYISKVRNAPNEIEQLRSLVQALNGVFSKLRDKPSNVDADVVQKCIKDLTTIQERLNEQSSMKRLGLRALKWPFSSKEMSEKVQALERYLAIFSTSIQQGIDTKIDDAEQERLLDKLAYVADAKFDSYENSHRHRSCLENTRVDVLQQAMDWAADFSSQCIFWLKGLAGTGKSTISTTVASRLKAKSGHIASYFFKRGHSDLANARNLIPTIVRQLSQHSSLYRQLVLAAVKEEPGIGQSANIRAQYDKLLMEPLRTLSPSDRAQDPFIIVIDALDECDEQKDLRLLLNILATTKDLPRLRLKIFVTSRPELPIRHGFEERPNIFYRDLALQNVSRSVVDGDIKVFFNHELRVIQRDFYLPASWIADVDLDTLVQQAGGLFIFAATACRYIGGSSHAKPQERLKQICSAAATNMLMTEELDHMYAMILQSSITGKYTDEERESIRVQFHYIVGSIVLLLNPLSVAHLFDLVGGSCVESQHELECVLQTLHAVIDVPEDRSNPVQPLHLSFRDFLLDSNRCSDRQFWIDEQQAHHNLALDCMQLLSSFLFRNMCGLRSLGTLTSEIDPVTVENTLSKAVQYACRYWADHAQRGKTAIDDNGRIHKFLLQHFLHWLEAMSLIGRVSEAVILITNLTTMTDLQAAPLAHDFIYDCRRFSMSFKFIIERAPEQVYGSALLFSPLQSIVRKTFKDSVARWVRLRPHLDDQWGPVLQTIECGYNVGGLKFLNDGKQLATFSRKHTFISGMYYGSHLCKKLDIWDFQTGDCHSYLKAPAQEYDSENISLDGQLVVSVSRDYSVSLWDIAESKYRFISRKSYGQVFEATFSPDSRTLALVSEDGNIHLLDTRTGHSRFNLSGDFGHMVAVVFSPNCNLIAALNKTGTLRVWNIETGSLCCARDCYGNWISGVAAFSPDSKFLAVIMRDEGIQFLNVESGKCQLKFEIDPLLSRSKFPILEGFSPNGDLLAARLYDGRLQIWNTQTGNCHATLDGALVASSPDNQWLAILVRDYEGPMRLWNVIKQEYCATFDTQGSRINAYCFSPDGCFLVSASDDGTVRLFDLHMSEYRDKFESESERESKRLRVNNIAFSPNGALVSSEGNDGKIRLWNPETGDCCFDYEGDHHLFSSDSRLAVSTSSDGIRLLDLLTNHSRLFWKGDKARVGIVSSNCHLIAFGNGNSIQVWNVQSGHHLFTFKDHSDDIDKIDVLIFSPTGTLLGSLSIRTGLRFWNTRTGQLIFHHTESAFLDNWIPKVIAPNDELVAVKSGRNHRLWILDVLTGLSRILGDELDLVDYSGEVVFSPNSQIIASGLLNANAVRLWDTQTGKRILTIPCLSLKPRIEFLAGVDAIFVDGMAHEIGSTKMTKSQKVRYNRLFSNLQIDFTGQWVTKSSQRVLWLPPEQRNCNYAVWRNKFALASENGRMTFICFEDEPDQEQEETVNDVSDELEDLSLTND